MRFADSPVTRRCLIGSVLLAAFLGTACSSFELPGPATVERTPPPPDPEVVRLSALMTPTASSVIPAGERIVVARVSNFGTDSKSPCGEAVKDALMRRLIANADYEVLSRDDLDWLFTELNMGWGGHVNSMTAAKLGELLGPAYFVVGRIGYCGQTANLSPDSEAEMQYSIFASLQIIHLQTGRVVVSSAAEGNFVPRSANLDPLLEMPPSPSAEPEQAEKRLNPGVIDAAHRWLGRVPVMGSVLSAVETVDSMKRNSSGTGDGEGARDDAYPLFRAAEDLANGFADSFFARPVWQTVEMWNDLPWSHTAALHFVKLGDCGRAVSWIEEDASREVPRMNQKQLARYLHNYGVSLLCANDPARGVAKLQSAYRLGYAKTTLRMLGLAQRMSEWSLRSEDDVQPEVDLLTSRTTRWLGD